MEAETHTRTEATVETVPKPDTKTPVVELDELLSGFRLSLEKGAEAQDFEDPASFEKPSRLEQRSLFATPDVRVEHSVVDITQAEVYLERLKTARAMCNVEAGNLAQFRERVREVKDTLDEVSRANLQSVSVVQRPLELEWTELATFIEEARVAPDQPVPLKVPNVSVVKLIEDDAAFRQFAKLVPKKSALTMEEMTALIVISEPLHREAIMEKFGELAEQGLAMVIGDIGDEPIDKISRHFEGGKYAALKGNESWKEHFVPAGNPIRTRQKDEIYEADLEDLWISPAVVLAAKMVKGDEVCGLAVAQAGDAQKVLLKSARDFALRWDLTDRDEIAKIFKDAVIPLVRRKAGVYTFWGGESLSTHPDYKQYTVARAKHYIQKIVIEHLNSIAWEPNTDHGKKILKRTINTCLRKHSSDQDSSKMLRGGQVLEVKDVIGPDGMVRPDQVKLVLDLQYKYLLKSGIIEIRSRSLDFIVSQEEGGLGLA